MKELGGEEECDVTYFPKPYVMLSNSATEKCKNGVEVCKTQNSYFEIQTKIYRFYYYILSYLNSESFSIGFAKVC